MNSRRGTLRLAACPAAFLFSASLAVVACTDDSGGEDEVAEGSESESGSEDESTDTGETGPPDFDPPPPECGNGFVEEGEQCDDGNLEDGDGCDSACQIPCGLLWETGVSSTDEDVAPYVNELAVGPGGEIVVLGSLSAEISEYNDDIWLASFSASGELQWNLPIDLGDEDDEYTGGLAVDGEGNIYISATDESGDDRDIWVARYGADGSQSWATTVPELVVDGKDEAYGLAVSAAGEPFISGSLRVGDGDSDFYVARLSAADGSEEWSATWSGAVAENGFSLDRGGPVALGPDGVVWTMAIEYVDFETFDVHLLSFAQDGGLLGDWTPQTTDVPHEHVPQGLVVGPDGAVYFGIRRLGAGATFWLHRLDPSMGGAEGEVVWIREPESFIDEGEDWALEGIAMAEDGLYVGGDLVRDNPDDSWAEAWVQRLEPVSGESFCETRHTGVGVSPIIPNLLIGAVAAGADGTLIAGGRLSDIESQRSFWIGAFRGP